jgi:hypothetical protein
MKWILIAIITSITGHDEPRVKAVSAIVQDNLTKAQCEKLAKNIAQTARSVSHTIIIEHSCVEK